MRPVVPEIHGPKRRTARRLLAAAPRRRAAKRLAVEPRGRSEGLRRAVDCLPAWLLSRYTLCEVHTVLAK
jgi:hypothetical protein